MTPFKHWQDPVNAVLGLWLAISPWILGFQVDVAAMPNAVIVGLALFVVAATASFRPRGWHPWASLVLGAWLAASPWALDFSFIKNAKLDALVVGILAASLAGWVLLEGGDDMGSRDDRKAA